MAAGEYVSVSSQSDTEQSDTEQSDTERERLELATGPKAELEELAGIYQARGVDADVARTVAQQMTAFDALGTHAREHQLLKRTFGII